MHTTTAFRGLSCIDCDAAFDPADVTHRCPDCGGLLTAEYDRDGQVGDPTDLGDHRFEGVARYADLLPFPAERLVTMTEGGTPLVACPALADDLGVGTVYVKDEARNPTGSVRDRGMAVAVTAALERGAADVGLPTTGAGGHSAAAYAARAGLDSHSFVPSRATFDAKAMINVHGGDMSVVEGRLADAQAAFADAVADEPWYSLAAFETPYRQEGQKTLAYELADQLDGELPDAVVSPTGQGLGLVGLARGAADLQTMGLLEETPPLYAAQAAGCAPIAAAFAAGRDRHEPVERPDTICGSIEVADPAGSPLVLDALRESGGGAVTAEDTEILEAATSMAAADGVELNPASGAAVAGARELVDRGDLGAGDTVVLVNTASAHKGADVLRSHLMSKGI
ncbi:MAG: threonine synthase [Haloarculaceae archaeon]